MVGRAAGSPVRAPAASCRDQASTGAAAHPGSRRLKHLSIPHTLPIARSSMRAIAPAAPPPIDVGEGLARDNLPSRGVLLDGPVPPGRACPHRVAHGQAPVCHGRTSADGWSSPAPGPHHAPEWRMHIRAGNGGDAREGINDHARRPARPPALDQLVESPALDRADRCDRTTSAACRACTRLPGVHSRTCGFAIEGAHPVQTTNAPGTTKVIYGVNELDLELDGQGRERDLEEPRAGLQHPARRGRDGQRHPRRRQPTSSTRATSSSSPRQPA